MKNLNLVVIFRLSSDGQMRVKRASRIKVDGRGSLMLYDWQNGAAEQIELRALQSFSIKPVSATRS